MKESLTTFLAIVLATLTSACSSILPDASEQILAAPVVPPADYRQLIRTGVPASLTNGADVSELRKTVGPEPGDWMACLKSVTNSNINSQQSVSFFSVFFEGGKVKDFRRAVLIDQCESAAYSPLPPPAQVTKTPIRKAPNKGPQSAPSH